MYAIYKQTLTLCVLQYFTSFPPTIAILFCGTRGEPQVKAGAKGSPIWAVTRFYQMMLSI